MRGATTAYGIGIVLALTCAGSASAQTGGAAYGESGTPSQANGPATTTAPTTTSTSSSSSSTAILGASGAPSITQVVCKTQCSGGSVAPGGTIIVRGKKFAKIRQVVFMGASGDADDTSVEPLHSYSKSAVVPVPSMAVSGPVAVINKDRAGSTPSKSTITIAAPSTTSTTASGSPSIDLAVQNSQVFYDGTHPATLSYTVKDAQPASVYVDLVRLSDNTSIAHWGPTAVAPNTPQKITWDGTAGGTVQKDGRYQFKLSAQSTTGVQAQAAQAGSTGIAQGAFSFARYAFPIRGPHSYGDAIAAFGGARNHQGQDVFADCGTPLVAARGGTVKFSGFQSRAGNYLVIDGDATGVDNVYMHMREPSPLKKGDKVQTGQYIGHVGQTGDATACHLHFEEWSSPGWYTGGAAYDPKPDLLAWDKIG